MTMRWGVVIGAAMLLAPGSAAANAPAPFSRAVGATPGVVVERQSPLTVEREELDIDCAGDRDHPTCTFRATYFLFNPAPQEEEVLGAFYGVARAALYRHGNQQDEPAVRVELDGKSAETQATEEQIARMDAIVAQDPEIRALLETKTFAYERQPFHATVAAGARAKLVFDGTMKPLDYTDDDAVGGYAYPALFARHPLLADWSGHPFRKTAEDYLYLVTPITAWAGDPVVTVRIRHRSENGFTAQSPGGWRSTRADGTITDETAIRASARKNVRFRLTDGKFPLVNGGPLVGIGPRLGREELHVRAGYEIGGPSWAVYGITADTNFDTYVTPALTIEAATPGALLVLPSLGLGVGVPVQFRKDAPTRVGIRTQLTVSFPLVSLVFPVDIYPVANSSGAHAEGAFLTQFSF